VKDDRDYKLDLSPAAAGEPSPAPADGNPTARPFVSVHFACCNVYVRIYRSPDGQSYRGHCPRCAKPVHFAVGPSGTDARTFRVS
jgi:hypothetical protein